MIRIVGYLVSDVSMQQAAPRAEWFTIYEAPPNLSASQALERCAARFRTWELRLKIGSYRGITRVALEASGDIVGPAPSTITAAVRLLEVHAREGKPS